jgi:hypothetical protein
VERVLPPQPIADTSLYFVDPWFLTAAETLREDSGATPNHNGYDRTLFPCYDDRLDVLGHGPNEAIRFSPGADSSPPTTEGWSPVLDFANFPANQIAAPPWVHTWPETATASPVAAGVARHYPLGRRIPRIASDGILNAKYHERFATDTNQLRLIIDPAKDSDDPGLAVLRQSRSGQTVRTTTAVRSNLSYVSLVDHRSGGTPTVYTIVYENRQIAIDSTGNFDTRHNLAAFTAVDGINENADASSQNYHDERVGYVTLANDLIRNGEGTFQFAVHRSVDPSVRVGDFMMLLRRRYLFDAAATPRPRVMDKLDFSFVKIKSVNSGPSLVGNQYVVEVTVTGSDWTFHPIQIYIPSLQGNGPYRRIGGGVTQPAGYNPPVYDYTAVVPASGTNNPGHTGTNGDPLYGTQVVLMRNVVDVIAN